MVIIKLTVALELNIEKAHKRKVAKHTALVLDIKSKGFECDIIALEIGSKGYVSPDNQQRLKSILKLCSNPVSFKNFPDDLSKLSILHFPSTTLTRNRLGIITLCCQFLEVEFVFAPLF